MVYLIHLERKIGTEPDPVRGRPGSRGHKNGAQHYVGFVTGSTAGDLERRMVQHRTNRGGRLLKAANGKGIAWTVVRTWPQAGRSWERVLKNRSNAPKLCPVCNPMTWQRNGIFPEKYDGTVR